MKKAIWLVTALLVLIVIRCMGAGQAETYPRWVSNPKVSIEIVDRVADEGRYSMYYCVGEDFVIILDRDILNNRGWITMMRDTPMHRAVYYEGEWKDEEHSKRIIDNLVESALALSN